LSRRLICEVLNIFISLDEEMLTSVDGLWGWDVTVRVDGNDSLWGLYSEDTSGYDLFESFRKLTLVDLNVLRRID